MSSVNADFITPKYSNVVNIWPAYSKDFSAGTFTTDVLITPSFSATSIAFTSATATYLNVGTLAGSHMNVSSLSASTLSVSTITVNNLSIGTLTCTALDSGIISIGTQGGSLLATASCGTLGEFLASSNGFEVTAFADVTAFIGGTQLALDYFPMGVRTLATRGSAATCSGTKITIPAASSISTPSLISFGMQMEYGTIGGMRVQYYPGITGYPTADKVIIGIGDPNGVSFSNSVLLTHKTTGYLNLRICNSAGADIVTADSTSVWSPASTSTGYNFEVGWDLVNGYNMVYRDGSRVINNSTTGSRQMGPRLFSGLATSAEPHSIANMALFGTWRHNTSSFSSSSTVSTSTCIITPQSLNFYPTMDVINFTNTTTWLAAAKFYGGLAIAKKLYTGSSIVTHCPTDWTKSCTFGVDTAGVLSITPTSALAIAIDTVQEYTDNAAAVTAGLSVGSIYRTGDLLKIVHS